MRVYSTSQLAFLSLGHLRPPALTKAPTRYRGGHDDCDSCGRHLLSKWSDVWNVSRMPKNQQGGRRWR
jgi:hypothetical protein